MVIRRIAPVSIAKVSAVIYALVGVILGVCFALIGIMRGVAGGDGGESMFVPMFGVAAVVFLPVLYGVMGFVVTLIGAWLYNAVAGTIGGIEIDVT